MLSGLFLLLLLILLLINVSKLNLCPFCLFCLFKLLRKRVNKRRKINLDYIDDNSRKHPFTRSLKGLIQWFGGNGGVVMKLVDDLKVPQALLELSY